MVDPDHPLLPSAELPVRLDGQEHVLMVYPVRRADDGARYVPVVVAKTDRRRDRIESPAAYQATAVVTGRGAYVLECPVHLRRDLQRVLGVSVKRVRAAAGWGTP